ncbi:MAG: serpin family protein [Caldicoprobacterales bacterium]
MKVCLCLLLCITISLGLVIGCSLDLSSDNISDNIPNTKSANNITTNKVDSDFVSRNTEFAFKIFRQINSEDKDKNIIISPISISTALAMTYQGAQSTTKEVMAKTLEYTNMDLETLNENYKNILQYLNRLDKKVELNMANSIWIRDGEPILENFLSVNKEYYYAFIEELDFSKDSAAHTINDWISQATKQKIKEMIEPPIAPETLMYLINAIYFKGEWTKKFDEKNTYNAPFHGGDGSTQDVMMMTLNGEVEYGQGNDFQVVRLPYGKGDLAMYCILPESETPINEFVENLDKEKWDDIKSSIEQTNDVILKIPRFKLEYGIKSLKNCLIDLGMEEAFSDMADFSGIRNDLSIYDVLHKAVIEVNEKGSEAAAATVVEMRVTSALEPTIFSADRPFVFIIADLKTDSILFIGKVYSL